MSKYDWDVVDKYVKWIATDKDGMTCGYTREPVVCSGSNMWVCSKAGDLVNELYGVSIFKGDWRESLEKRP